MLSRGKYIQNIKKKNSYLFEEPFCLEVLDEYVDVKRAVRLKDKYGEIIIKSAESLYNHRANFTFIKVAVNKEKYIENYIKYNNKNVPNFTVIKYTNKANVLCDTKYGKILTSVKTLITTKLFVFSSYINKNEAFINMSKEKFGDQFNYENLNIKGVQEKIILYCNKHNGHIDVLIANHLNNGGCRVCNKRGIYCSKISERNSDEWKKEHITFYLLNLYNKEENFFKLGLSLDTDARIRKIKSTYEVLPIFYVKITKYMSNEAESYFLGKYSKNKYVPLLKFSGYTECYNFTNKEILSLINYMQFELEDRKFYYQNTDKSFDEEAIERDKISHEIFKSFIA